MTVQQNIEKNFSTKRHLYHNPGNVQKLTNIMPDKIRNKLLRSYFSWKFGRYMKRKLGGFYNHVDPCPVAPAKLISRTSLLTEKDLSLRADPDFHLFNGYAQMLSWIKVLENHGFDIRTAGSIMEFGCGSARLIRHLRCIDGINLVGTDLDGDTIEWCSKNIPGIEFHQNSIRPPLEFAKDNMFDLVFASSVFTHIPLEAQHLWINELCRVVRPGGYLLCDVNGKYHQKLQLKQEEIDILYKNGIFTLTPDAKGVSLSTKITGTCDIFQTRSEVLKAFRSSFVVVDYIPVMLDLLVLQKPE